MVIGHLGNWELIGLAVNASGVRLHSLARPIENPWIDRWLGRFRTQTGQEIIPKHHALGKMMRVLASNETLVIQIDQNVRQGGASVEFFGRPASTHRSPALLSLKHGTPVVVANIYREGGRHTCVLSDPLDPELFRSLEDPVTSLTQALSDRFEDCVRRIPNSGSGSTTDGKPRSGKRGGRSADGHERLEVGHLPRGRSYMDRRGVAPAPGVRGL